MPFVQRRTLGLLLLLLVAASCISALSVSASAVTGTDSSISSNDTSVAAAHTLAELLSLSSSSPLIPGRASLIQRWAEGAVGNTDRHYTLVLFLTASKQCAQCAPVQDALRIVAETFERARYPLANGSRSLALSAGTTPAHHVFFAVLDANRPLDTSAGEQMSNMQFFSARKLSRVPELLLLPFTVPEGLGPEGHVRRDTGEATGNGTLPPREAAHTAARRRELRGEALQERRWTRHQRTRIVAAAAASAEAASTPAAKQPAPPQSEFSWLDHNQVISLPLSSGLQSAHLISWLRQHVEAHVTDADRAATARGEMDALEKLPLHRSKVVRRGGVRLPVDSQQVAPKGKAGSGVIDPTPAPLLVSILSRLFGILMSFQPFFSSFLLLGAFVLSWRRGIARGAIVPAAFFLWNAVGSMNNIGKNMPLIGMGKEGPIFFYPGHGSFVGEACLIAVIYAGMAACVLWLNRVAFAQMPVPVVSAAPTAAASELETDESEVQEESEEEEEKPENQEAIGSKRPSDTDAAAGAASAQASGAPSAPPSTTSTTAAASAPAPLKPGQVRGSSAMLAAHRAMQERQQRLLQAQRNSAAADLLGLTPRQWALLLIAMLHVLFSLLRSVYTRKNARYRFGYVWP